MSKSKRKASVVVLCLLASILMSVLIGCNSESATSGNQAQPQQKEAEPKTGGTITIGYAAEPETLDVLQTGSSAVDEISGFMGGSLLYSDPATREVKPYLAESYKISEDGKTWTFTIRSGVSFHDGTPLTAKTIKETYDRILAPDSHAGGRAMIDAVKSVKAPDDRTLILELKEPSAPLLQNLTSPGWLQPLSMKAVDKYGADYGRHPMGIGPWKFESWQTGQSITFARNEAFHWPQPTIKNQGPPRAEKLVVKFIKDNQTRIAALDSGSIDIATTVSAKDVKKYRNNPQYEVLEQMQLGLGLYVTMNMKNPIFQDIQVRKALNMAINKEAIIQAALQGEGIVAHGPLPPTIFGYDKSAEEYGYKYNPEEAKKLLDAAGWKANADGIREKDGNPLALTLLSKERSSKEAQLIQAMLGEIGVKTKIETMEPGALLAAAAGGKFEMVLQSYTAIDPDILYIFWHSSQADGGYNFASLKDDKLDALAVKGRTTMDTEARKQIYAEAQKYMVDQAYIVPVYINKQFTVVNRRVKGIRYENDGYLFNDSWVDR